MKSLSLKLSHPFININKLYFIFPVDNIVLSATTKQKIRTGFNKYIFFKKKNRYALQEKIKLYCN